MRTTFCLLAALWSLPLWTQVPASNQIHANRVQAGLLNDGRAFTDGSNGVFLVPQSPGLSDISLMRASGLWLGAKDPGGNLLLSVTRADQSDFEPGAVSFMFNDPGPGSFDNGLLTTRVWRTSAADIMEHMNDLNDNGVIDVPVASIWGWPGVGNPYFDLYNPGDLPGAGFLQYADYFDVNNDGFYDPSVGDFPTIFYRSCPYRIADEFMWAPCNIINTLMSPISGARKLPMQVETSMSAYACQVNSPLGNSVIVRYKLLYTGAEPLTEVYFGVYNEFSVGDVSDDYVGCDPVLGMAFAYNADAEDALLGLGAPALGVKVLQRPRQVIVSLPGGGFELQQAPLRAIMPVDPLAVYNAEAYYNLLSGNNPDGTPALNGGFPFAGNPTEAGSDSEITAGSTPGPRASLISVGPFDLAPGAISEFILAYTFARKDGFSAVDNVRFMYPHGELWQDAYDACFDESVLDMLCTEITLASKETSADDLALTLSPNPSKGRFWIHTEASMISRIEVFDAVGRRVIERRFSSPKTAVEVDVVSGSGMYFVRVYTADGRIRTLKTLIGQ